MERKIGEIFECNGEWYQCVVAMQGCREYSFRTRDYCTRHSECMSTERSDKISVIFKKLEKVGEPYEFFVKNRGIILLQKYKMLVEPYINRVFCNIHYEDNTIDIELKQNKEDMEEKNKAEGLPLLRLVGKYMNSLIDYATFEKAVKDLYSNKEESKPLKEFDLKAAKAGKPVCTRDGRKARIICFDRKLTYKNVSYPILALVKRDGEDDVCCYNEKGKVLVEDDLTYKDDLMMLPEKKEGWAKVRKDINLYDTKEEADRKMIGNDEYVTAKVCWEE